MLPKRLVLAVAATAFMLLLAEVFVRCFVPVRNVGPSWTEYHPVYGQALKKNLSCRRISPEFSISFTTNSLGFRGSEPASRPVDVILFLGDSYTMGYGVTDGEEFPALVKAGLAGCLGTCPPDIVNAGIGRGNGYWVKFLRHKADDYRPRFVVLEVCENDFADNLREGMFCLTKDGQLIEHTLRKPTWKRRLQMFIDSVPGLNRTYLFGLVRQVRLPSVSMERSSNAQPMEPDNYAARLAHALIGESIAICNAKGWGVLVITEGLTDAQSSALQAHCADFNVEIIAIPRKTKRPELYYQVDGHWNSIGHRYVAEVVVDYLAHKLTVAPDDKTI